MAGGDALSAIPESVDDVDTCPLALRRPILIVDDIPANLVAMEAALAPLERQIVIASSGNDALAQLLQRDFSLVLLDVQMPHMDGYETARLIRARERTKHLPIIFVTAHEHDAADVRRAYRLGAVDFLFKPLDEQILLAKTSVFVALQEQAELLASERLRNDFEARRREYETAALRQQMEHEQRAKAELAKLNAVLAAEDQQKDRFLAILAHELRNPLASLRTGIDLLQHAPDRPPRPDTLAILDRQVQQVTRLVEDLLDISRIKANKLELRLAPCDLRELIRTAVQSSTPFVESRHHRLELQLPAQPVDVVADEARIVQVLTNLVNNAARYTNPGGAITVVCDRGDEHATVLVKDNGIGIEPAVLEQIFEIFVQARVGADGAGGLGLGLALARQLVELHKGTLHAHSEGRGAGSTFELVLPLSRMERLDTPHAVAPQPRIEPLRIAVIDDNEDARWLLAELLGELGHVVTTADDGLAGLAMIRDKRPHIAFVDLGLPGIDGWSIARSLRTEEPGLPTKLIALSGYGTESDFHSTREAGFDAHIVKPATLSSLIGVLTTDRRAAPT